MEPRDQGGGGMESLSIVGLIDVIYCHYPFSWDGEDEWIEYGTMSEGSHARKLSFATFTGKIFVCM